MTPQQHTQPPSEGSKPTGAWWRTISGGMWIIGVATLARWVSYLPALVNPIGLQCISWRTCFRRRRGRGCGWGLAWWLS